MKWSFRAVCSAKSQYLSQGYSCAFTKSLVVKMAVQLRASRWDNFITSQKISSIYSRLVNFGLWCEHKREKYIVIWTRECISCLMFGWQEISLRKWCHNSVSTKHGGVIAIITAQCWNKRTCTYLHCYLLWQVITLCDNLPCIKYRRRLESNVSTAVATRCINFGR